MEPLNRTSNFKADRNAFAISKCLSNPTVQPEVNRIPTTVQQNTGCYPQSKKTVRKEASPQQQYLLGARMPMNVCMPKYTTRQ